MRCKLTFLLVFVISVCGETISASWAPFDPYRYVYFNELIIEGRVVEDVEVPLTKGLNGNPREPGWYYPTNKACLVVEEVLLQRRGAAFAVGDTVCFRYATSDRSYNPDKPGLVGLTSGSGGPLGFEIGERGLFGLNRLKTGEMRRGYYFALDDSMTSCVYEVLSSLQADSTKTIGEIRKHYHGKKWQW